VKAAHLLVGVDRVPLRASAHGVTLTLPARAPGDVDQIVVLELAR
jgi:hypothetical protein